MRPLTGARTVMRSSCNSVSATPTRACSTRAWAAFTRALASSRARVSSASNSSCVFNASRRCASANCSFFSDVARPWSSSTSACVDSRWLSEASVTRSETASFAEILPSWSFFAKPSCASARRVSKGRFFSSVSVFARAASASPSDAAR